MIAGGQQLLAVCLTKIKKVMHLTCFNKSETYLEVSPLGMLKATVLASTGIRTGNSKTKFISLHALKETSFLDWGLKKSHMPSGLRSKEDMLNTDHQTINFQFKGEHYYH